MCWVLVVGAQVNTFMYVSQFSKYVFLPSPESLNFQSHAEFYWYLIGNKLILILHASDNVLGKQVDDRKKALITEEKVTF